MFVSGVCGVPGSDGVVNIHSGFLTLQRQHMSTQTILTFWRSIWAARMPYRYGHHVNVGQEYQDNVEKDSIPSNPGWVISAGATVRRQHDSSFYFEEK